MDQMLDTHKQPVYWYINEYRDSENIFFIFVWFLKLCSGISDKYLQRILRMIWIRPENDHVFLHRNGIYYFQNT